MKVFIDTSVLLDVILKRPPFYADAIAIWTLAEERRIEGQISAISFTNIFYVVRKLENVKTARRALPLLRDIFTPIGCDGRILNMAIDGVEFKDFEDAVQYFSAIQAKAICMVSRNPDDFPDSRECPVMTPTEFLATHSFK